MIFAQASALSCVLTASRVKNRKCSTPEVPSQLPLECLALPRDVTLTRDFSARSCPHLVSCHAVCTSKSGGGDAQTSVKLKARNSWRFQVVLCVVTNKNLAVLTRADCERMRVSGTVTFPPLCGPKFSRLLLYHKITFSSHSGFLTENLDHRPRRRVSALTSVLVVETIANNANVGHRFGPIDKPDQCACE